MVICIRMTPFRRIRSLLFLSFILTMPNTFAQPSMRTFLPTSVRNWTFSEAPRLWSGRAIFDYIDGAGEIYLAYDFRDLLVQRYASPGQEEILVEIFDMGLARNAFGVFTYMKGRGPAVRIGQEGEYKSGLLCFWRGRYFVCVKIEKENREAKEVVLQLGRLISNAIHEDGELPAILGYLPKREVLPATLRYFFTNEILNIHFYIADNNPLLLDGKTEGVLVRMKADKSHVLLVGYPDREHADSAYANFVAHYLPNAREPGIVQMKNKKWTARVQHGSYIIVVLDARTKSEARNRLESIGRRLP